MKKILSLLAITVILLAGATSCKSKQKIVTISGADIEAVQTQTQPVVENTQAVVEPPKAEVVEKTINESFKLASGETNQNAFSKSYHVVVGSFGVQDNAKNLQRTLNNEGNNAIVVINEQGMYRVLIASYDEYSQARAKISQIESRFPDAWVLRQK